MQHNLKRMKHTVATCVHLLAAPQWTLVDAELDAGAELDATRGGGPSAGRSMSPYERREVRQCVV
jgi:hypothetical protein